MTDLYPHSVIVPILDGTMPRENQIRRVPPLVRHMESRTGTYSPTVVSLGPYHHGKPEFEYAEAFKQTCVDVFVAEHYEDDNNEMIFYYNKILERIDEIRSWYENLPNDIDNNVLANMILRDSCFFIYYLYASTLVREPKQDRKYAAMLCYFGRSQISFIMRDLQLLENQIPLWVPKFLFPLSMQGDGNIRHVFDDLLYGQFEDGWVPRTHSFEKSLHFLHVCYQKFVALDIGHATSVSSKILSKENCTYRFQSVTNLQAKGVNFKRSADAISFTSCSPFYGDLSLPALDMTSSSFTLYSNLMAYEMSPIDGVVAPVILSYVTFMKSLIANPDDVKILREKNILFNHMGSDDEVVKVFKDLDTFGFQNTDIFSDLRRKMEKYCGNTLNTWRADLTTTYFNTPWKTIAVVVAFTTLGLAVLQAYLKIIPARGINSVLCAN